MNTTLKLKNKSVASLLMAPLFLSSALLAVTQVQAAQAANTETITEVVAVDSSRLSDASEQIGRAVVRQLVNAHEALALGNRDKARKNLQAAGSLNYSALRMMPFAVINDDIFNAKGKLAETELFYDDLLPIYTELDELAMYAPEKALKAKLHLRKAESFAHKNKTKASIKKLDEVMEVVSKTGIYLPVVYVNGQIKAALHDLKQPESDGRTAIKAVDNAIESLKQYSEEVVTTPGT